MQQFHEVGGHVFRREGKRSGPVWYANYRLPDGRQVQRLRDVELWRSALRAELSTRSKNKLLTELHGIFKRAEKVWGLPSNPVEEVELLRERPRVDFDPSLVEILRLQPLIVLEAQPPSLRRPPLLRTRRAVHGR
jgi:hypothetical protein